MAQKLRPQAETLSGSPQPNFIGYSPAAILAKRAPTAADTGYPLAQVWNDKIGGFDYILNSVSGGSANWLQLAYNGGPGSFTTLTSTSTTTLATTVAGTVNTFGNASGATSVNILNGTGASGWTSANGALTFNSGTGALSISSDAAATTVTVGAGAAAKTVTLGSSSSTSATTVQSGSGALNITSANGALTVASGTGAMNISADAAATTVNVGTGAAVKTVTIGSTNSTSATTVQAGSAGIALTGNVVSANSVSVTTGNITAVAGDVIISGNGAKLNVNGGAATDFIGTATLTSGTVNVNNTNISDATDRIFLCRSAVNGSVAIGELSYVIVDGVRFTINALNPASAAVETNDVSTVSYFIVRQV
jgi:hypothetical protein